MRKTIFDCTTQQSTQIDLSPEEETQLLEFYAEEAAKEPERQRIAAIEAEIIGDTILAALKAMTAAEFDTWWAANVTTLAQANNVLKRIARVLLRRVL